MNDEQFHDGHVVAVQLQSGNPHAFQYILDQFSPALCFFASRLTGDEGAATVIAERALLKLWEVRCVFHNFTAIRNFLYNSVHEGCVLHLQEERPAIADKQVQHEIIRAEVLRHICNNRASFPHTGPIRSTINIHH